ncbi:hypothetical protein GCM10022232_48880 [Streptomyces plumbiresistens]|uniref:Uncharacterized protein n=1 Tax=Streptomyces plumbiresistens TaxID=511811 RepID=A0ABP7RYB4_9ACTN
MVAEQREGPDAPVGARDRAVSHGGKGTVLPVTRLSRGRRDSGVRMDLDRLRSTPRGRRLKRGAYARRIEN